MRRWARACVQGLRRGGGRAAHRGGRRKRRSVACVGAGLVWVMLEAALASAAPPVVVQDEVVLEDLIAVEVIDRYVYGFDAAGGAGHRIQLELGEQVVSTRQRGRLGLVVTDRRVLALAAGRGDWRELSLRLGESVLALDWVAPRVLVVATAQRILGFDSGQADWLAIDVGPQEAVTHVELGASTAVVLTGYHAYGLSPDAGGFFREPLRLHERIERVTASATIGQVRTNQRILVFRSPTGSWLVEDRPIH